MLDHHQNVHSGQKKERLFNGLRDSTEGKILGMYTSIQSLNPNTTHVWIFKAHHE